MPSKDTDTKATLLEEDGGATGNQYWTSGICECLDGPGIKQFSSFSFIYSEALLFFSKIVALCVCGHGVVIVVLLDKIMRC